jgi:uncharacterized alkaline shock family protein YloU
MSEQPKHEIAGKIEITPLAIARLASHYVLQSYGVVGMAAPNLASEIVWNITRDPNRGIEARIEDGRIFIDLYIIIEYGTRIATVASSTINAVRFNVEKATGMPVAQVCAHVQGVRVRESESQPTEA